MKIIIPAKCILFNKIAIFIIFNILYSNFVITTASILKTRDKSIKEIQNIIQSKDIKYKAKQLTCQLEDKIIAILVAFYEGKNFKEKVNSNHKYFNCHHKKNYS